MHPLRSKSCLASGRCTSRLIGDDVGPITERQVNEFLDFGICFDRASIHSVRNSNGYNSKLNSKATKSSSQFPPETKDCRCILPSLSYLAWRMGGGNIDRGRD